MVAPFLLRHPAFRVIGFNWSTSNDGTWEMSMWTWLQCICYSRPRPFQNIRRVVFQLQVYWVTLTGIRSSYKILVETSQISFHCNLLQLKVTLLLQKQSYSVHTDTHHIHTRYTQWCAKYYFQNSILFWKYKIVFYFVFLKYYYQSILFCIFKILFRSILHITGYTLLYQRQKLGHCFVCHISW